MLLTPSLCLSQFKCCGSNSSADWQHSAYILSREAEGRRVPDSCCKTVVVRCGQRAHPSNIYKVEVSNLAPAGACRGPSWPSRRPERQAQGRQGEQSPLIYWPESNRAGPSKICTKPQGQAPATERFQDTMACPRSPKEPVGH